MKYPTLDNILGSTKILTAYSREKWIDKMSGILTGAFGEWCKQRLSEEIKYAGHDWNAEVYTILKTAKKLLTGEIKTKSKFNKKAAFKEAISDADLSGGYLYAKKELKTHKIQKEQWIMLDKTTLDIEAEFKMMLEKFLQLEMKRL
jgi:hypothetical protein